MEKPVTVLIVDDSATIRTLFCKLLGGVKEIEVIGTAVDPLDAREKIKQLNPNVVTLDIEMPKMDGLSFLEKIMTLRPTPVIMVSTLTQKGASATIKALELGAVDYISKPLGEQTSDVLENLKNELVTKITAAAKANVSRNRSNSNNNSVLKFSGDNGKIIAIGSSTGGVEALRDIFKVLPANSPPIVMAQHMPEQFTASFAERLNGLSEVNVSEAVDGAKLMSGHAYLAPGGRHLKIIRKNNELICQLQDSPLVSGHRPSVDVLFESVADSGANAVGVILTGMGKDGAQGLLKMHRNGAYTIGQNQYSCVVYGMPKAAFALGAVDIELPLNEIASHILKNCERKASYVS